MAQKMGPDLPLVGSAPRMKVLHLPSILHLLRLQVEHSRRRVIFLVCLAFFLKIGLVWPPKPFYLDLYLRVPCALPVSLPFLY